MSPRRRRQFYAVLFLMLMGAAAELVVLGAVLPFLTLLSNPELIVANPLIADALRSSGADEPAEWVLVATIFFMTAALIAGAVRLTLTYASQKFAYRFSHDIAVEIHRRMLYQPYVYHISSNTSQFISALDKVQLLLGSVLLQLMLASTAVVIATFIIAGLIYIDPTTALTAAIGFSALYIAVSIFSRRRLRENSTLISAAFAERIKAVQESLGGIRDIILDGSQSIYLSHFARVNNSLRTAQAMNAFVAAAPRFVIETAGMILIAGLAFFLSREAGGFEAALPVLGALALGAQRLLPMLQQIYMAWAQITGNRAVVFDVVHLLELPLPERAVPRQFLPFEQEIRFEGVHFAYPGKSAPVLHDINFAIPKGKRVALIGKTGSGKSTLTDMLMGLLEPTAGAIRVDGVALVGEAREAWQRQIAHVPQAIFLADTSIEENIAFGVPEKDLDPERVRRAARFAQIDEFVESLPEGYRTSVGERGVRLSGGQRQRLGIARALYKAAPVLILDEATSALDDKTEAAVIDALSDLDERITVIMIAHRLSTIQGCDMVVRMENGRISEIGRYSELVQVAPHKEG